MKIKKDVTVFLPKHVFSGPVKRPTLLLDCKDIFSILKVFLLIVEGLQWNVFVPSTVNSNLVVM